jgi:hypothetical protein
MANWTRKAGLVPAVAAFAVVLSGCDLEVLNPGAIQDADLTQPELMPVLVAGASAEYNDIGDDYAFDIARLTDEAAGTGSYGSTQDYRTGFFDNQDSEGPWEQTHEAAWASGEAWIRLQDVLGADANSSEIAARLFVYMGQAHMRLGENFCYVVYDIGPSQPRSAAFDSAKARFTEGLAIATAAGSTQWRLAALAGIAQAEMGLAVHGGGSWATAASAANAFFAGGGDMDYVDAAIYAQGANTNLVERETWGRAEIGVYRTLAQAMFDADADPRVPYTKCGEWDDLVSPYPDNIPGGVTPTGDCAGQGSGAHQGADGDHAHYRQDKYQDRGADIPRATGLEMRLILAEAALNTGPDYNEFITQINLIRAEFGLAALAAPTAMGTLSFPHDLADMDAMPILDRERYATLWLTGRRLYDMDRWDHPFVMNSGWVVGSTSVANRVQCYPVARNECQLNPNLQGDIACS